MRCGASLVVCVAGLPFRSPGGRGYGYRTGGTSERPVHPPAAGSADTFLLCDSSDLSDNTRNTDAETEY